MPEPAPLRGPRIRRTAIPASATIVVRGDDGDPEITGSQARNFKSRYPEWGRFGVSAFYAVDVDDLLANQLDRFDGVLIFAIADLCFAGFEVVPTFRTPHVTVAFRGDLDERLQQLDSLAVERVANPYHVDELIVDDNEEDGR